MQCSCNFLYFLQMVKPFLEQKTYKKVKFAYSNDPQSKKVMESIFDMDKLESSFGGKSAAGFDYKTYAQRMKAEDKKMSNLNSGCPHPSDMPVLLHGHSLTFVDGENEASEEDHKEMLSHLDGTYEKNGVESQSTKDVTNVEIVAADKGHRIHDAAEGHYKKDAAKEGRT